MQVWQQYSFFKTLFQQYSSRKDVQVKRSVLPSVLKVTVPNIKDSLEMFRNL